LIAALLLVAWLPALIALPLHYGLINDNAGEHARLQLSQLSAVQQRRIDRELDRLIDGLALVGSRTQLRLSLDEFNRSARIEEQDFVGRILTDAIGSADQVSGVWVHGLNGHLVAGLGSVPESEMIFAEIQDRASPVIFPHWEIGACDARIWLSMPLQLDGRVIGRLSMRLEMTTLVELLADFPDPGLIGESVIVLQRPDGERCVLPGTLASGQEPAEFLQFAGQIAAVDPIIAQDQDAALWLTLPLKRGFGQLVLYSSPNLQGDLRNSLLAGYGFILVGVAFLATVFSVWISSRVAAPLVSLTTAVNSIERGERVPRLETAKWPSELQRLSAALQGAVTSQRKMLSALRQEIRFRRTAQKQLVDLANSDELTGLANRRYFIQRISDWLETADEETASLLYIDLDRFKPINDAHGHQAGDTVLEAIAERLKNVIRERDIAARLGGDEFAVLLIDENEVSSDAAMIARRIEASINQPISCADATLSVGCSIGITEVRAGMDVQSILARADQAMYAVKQQRRGRAGKT
jgi:diguanylate cyclase (GGDEF)-like protein